MKKWDAEQRPDFLEIAFSAERSVEDEIGELSKSTMGTIFLSYTFMFLYIILSLGKWTSFKQLLVNIKRLFLCLYISGSQNYFQSSKFKTV